MSLRKRQELTNIFNGSFKQSLLAGILRILMLTFDFFFCLLRNLSNFLKEEEKLASEDTIISL